MAAITKYQCLSRDLANQVHDFSPNSTNVLKVALTNTAPNVSTHQVLANISEISAGNGYTAGGNSVGTISQSISGGVVSIRGSNDVTVTATGGTVGPFQYAVLYNSSVSNDAATANPVIGYWNYGSPVTLNDGEPFTLDLDANFELLTITA